MTVQRRVFPIRRQTADGTTVTIDRDRIPGRFKIEWDRCGQRPIPAVSLGVALAVADGVALVRGGRWTHDHDWEPAR